MFYENSFWFESDEKQWLSELPMAYTYEVYFAGLGGTIIGKCWLGPHSGFQYVNI